MRAAMGAVAALAAMFAARAEAQSFTDPVRFGEQGGEALYRNICQGCHMPDGKGATGAGRVLALVRNKNLIEPGYPIAIVLRGRKGMPGFGAMLSDTQIAAVVTYVRTHFGNDFTAPVTADDVKRSR